MEEPGGQGMRVADFAFLRAFPLLWMECGGGRGRVDERDRGRRAWVRLCRPLNDTQSCGPAAEEAVVALAALAEVAAGGGASASLWPSW